MFAFEQFPVYQLSERFFAETQAIQAAKTISPSLKDQLLRASSSIVLNIAEGAGKHSNKEKRIFYTIARGSTQECVAVMRLLKIQGKIELEAYTCFYEQLTTISKMLSGLINKMSEK